MSKLIINMDRLLMDNEQRRLDWQCGEQIKNEARAKAEELVGRARISGGEAVFMLRLRNKQFFEGAKMEPAPSLFDLTTHGFIYKLLSEV